MKRLQIHALVAGLLMVFTLSSGFILMSKGNGEPGKGQKSSKNKTALAVNAKAGIKCGPSYNIYDNGDWTDPIVTSVTHINGTSGPGTTFTSFPAYELGNGADHTFIVNWASPTLGGAFRVFHPATGRVYTCQNIPVGVTSATFYVATPTCSTLSVAINGAWDTCP